MRTALILLLAFVMPAFAQDAAPSQTPVAVIEIHGSKTTGDAPTFATACKLAGVPESVAVEKVAYVKFARLASGVVSVTVKYKDSIPPAHGRADTGRRIRWRNLLPGFFSHGK